MKHHHHNTDVSQSGQEEKEGGKREKRGERERERRGTTEIDKNRSDDLKDSSARRERNDDSFSVGVAKAVNQTILRVEGHGGHSKVIVEDVVEEPNIKREKEEIVRVRERKEGRKNDKDKGEEQRRQKKFQKVNQ